MTKAEVKRRLNAISWLDDELKILDAKIERYEVMTQGHAIRYDVDKVQTSPSDPVSAAMEKLYELMGKRKKVQTKMIKAVAEAADLIDLATDTKGRLALHYRYIDCMSWRATAERMGYAERHVYRLHDDAIDEIFKKVSKCQ